MNPIAIRLLNQQLVAPRFSDPAPADKQLAAVEVDVVPLQVTSLEGTQPAVVDDGEQSLGVQVAGAEQLLHLLHRQHPRKPLLPAYLWQGQACKVRTAHRVPVAAEISTTN